MPASDLAVALDGCRRSHARLLALVAGLDDATVAGPSLLPDWSVGHVLTHLARNADSHAHLLAAAGRGEVADQYPGGPEQRAGDIEAGARRRARDISADLATAVDRLEAAWAATPAGVWAAGRARLGVAGERPLAEVGLRRWREVEVHHADLGLGFTPAAWDRAYVAAELGRCGPWVSARLPVGLRVVLVPGDMPLRVEASGPEVPDEDRVAVVQGLGWELAAWVLGRGRRAGWPALAPW